MEWIIGIYVAIGLFKTLKKLSSDAFVKPIWMYSQKNPILWALGFVMYVLMWPIAKG